MDQAAARPLAPTAVVFRDGFGERRHIVDPTGTQKLEVLCLRGDLTSTPSFEFALRERVGRIAGFRHAYFARVRAVERLGDAAATLALVSDATVGVRLSELVEAIERDHLILDINASLSLLRQLVPATAALHEAARDVSHGAISLERIIVTPNARAVLAEHAMGAAAEQLRFSHERYWKELRIAAPRSATLPKLDQRADVMQLGMVALALFLGRSISDDEYPARVNDLVGATWAISSKGELEPFPADLRKWLSRALQFNLRDAFTSAKEAHEELERVLGESDYLATPGALESFLTQYQALTAKKRADALPAASAAAPREVAAPAPPVVSAAPPPPPAPTPAPVAVRPAPIPTPVPVAASIPVAVPAPAPLQAPHPAPLPVREEIAFDHAKHADPFKQADRFEEHVEPVASGSRNAWTKKAAAAAVVVAVLGLGGFAARRYYPSAAPTPAQGTLIVNTSPAGAQVFVDGQPRGASPLTLSLPPGAHSLELRGEGESRSLPVTVTAGAQLSQYIELSKASATTGQLQVRSEPAGARVSVDGTARGTSPVTVTNLIPGEHLVVLDGEAGTTRQTVQIEAGATASIVAALNAAPGAPLSGWVSVSAPADVQLLEGGRVIGTSQSDRVMLATGSHQIDIVNDTLGFRTTKSVQVAAGKVTPIKVEFPKGTIALNAVPWAEVWIDGEKIGETPIGNYQLSLGSHEVLFRHPDLGEQRHVAVVTLTAPARLSVDMRKK